MDLSIIIVNYNSLEFLRKCIASIWRIPGNPKTGSSFSWEVIIVDNGSSDGSVAFINDEITAIGKSDLKLISLESNTGFAKASNAGAAKSQGNYLLFLNPDTEFIQYDIKNVIGFIKKKSEDEKVGIVGVKILNMDGSLQYSCRSFPTLARQFYESFFLYRVFSKSRIFGAYFMTFWDHGSVKEVDWLSGAFMLVKKDVFLNSGGFDEDYFIYSEDTDICLKLNRKGYKNYYYPAFSIRHFDAGIASRNNAKRNMQIWNSRRTYFRKNYSAFHAGIFSALYFFHVINRMILFYVFSLFKYRNSMLRLKAGEYKKTLSLYFHNQRKTGP